MNVGELKKLLDDFDDSDLVVMAKDSEGNNFSPLSQIDDGKYEPYSTWHGASHIRALNNDLIRQGFNEEDLCHGDDCVFCITLWPTN